MDELELTLLIDRMWTEWRVVQAEAAGLDSAREEDHIWCRPGDAVPGGAGEVYQARLTGPDQAADLDRILAPFRDRDRLVNWWVGPNSHPPELGARLEQAGLRRVRELLGMALDFEKAVPVPPEPGVTVRRLVGPKELDDFCRLSAAAYGLDEAGSRFFRRSRTNMAWGPDEPIDHWGAFVGDRLAAGGTLFTRDRVACLGGMGTDPEMRGRRLASLVTAATVEQAKAAGATAMVLQAAAPGVGLYKRLGFQEYCLIGAYAGRPGQSD